MTSYYKALKRDRFATYVEGFQWPEPGVWLEVEGELFECRNGLHVATLEQLPRWLHEELWAVEVDESAGVLAFTDKVVVRRARLVDRLPWDDRIARLFAADCAEHVLHLFERERPGDDRPRKAIEVARAYANGAAQAAAQAAAWDAAQAAAQAAAWAAAWAAERQWQLDILRGYLQGG